MSNVIAFPTKFVEVEEPLTLPPKSKYTILGVEVEQPKNGSEYLAICKHFLERECYEEILLSIMDLEYFEDADPQVKRLVNCYFELG
jgi:hypothetical protein